jgi:hypothetical protein
MILDHELLRHHRTERIFAELKRTERIVDVGCGIRPCPAFRCEEYICIEPHDEYVAQLRAWEAPGHLVIVQDKAEALASQPRKGTTVFLLDVIEHMEHEDGERIRDLMADFDQAVIFTPLGWFEQSDANPDAWGFNGGFWQKHRSAWMPEDFKGWRVKTWPQWSQKQRAGAILALRSPS